MTLTALTAGSFEFLDGATAIFHELQADARANTSGYTVGLTPGQHSVTIKTDPESRWQLTAKYVKQARTKLGVNAKGETFGVESQENGTPDLIAVIATSGGSGYVYAKDLYGGPMPTSPADAVKNFSTPRPPREIPVYLSDEKPESESSTQPAPVAAYRHIRQCPPPCHPRRRRRRR